MTNYVCHISEINCLRFSLSAAQPLGSLTLFLMGTIVYEFELFHATGTLARNLPALGFWNKDLIEIT